MKRGVTDVVLLGPVPPWRSGIADQTVRLARAMVRLGAPPLVLTFSRMYPRFLYPGESDRGEGAFPDDLEVLPILDGLEITAKTSGNAILEDAIMLVRKSVETGRTIAEPLAETKVFPPMVVQMIGVGEQTGALDAMLSKIAEFYEEEVDNAVEGLMKLMEPIMIAMLGTIIGTIVVAMYMPMFDLISKIG